MNWRHLPANLRFTIAHSLKQKFLMPIKQRRWRRLRRPIIFKGARGTLFRLHPGQYIDSVIFIDGIYERSFLEYLRRTLPRGGTMLDVGANIGNHSLYLRDVFEEIHCFEPNPTALEMLRDNIALNEARNIIVHPVGLGSQRATLPFLEDRDNLGVSRFVANAGPGTSALEVRVGDHEVESVGIDNITFIKIDVEGLEADVILGLKRTIEQHQPLIAYEYNGHDPAAFERIRELLAGYSFVEPRLEPGSVSALRKIGFYMANASSPELVTVESPEERYYPYILALPGRL